MPMLFVSMFGFLLAMWSAWQVPVFEARKIEIAADVQANNFLSYQSALKKYHTANPTANGTIADGSLTFQPGYIRDPNWTNLISGGQLYVYAPAGSMLPAAEHAVFSRSGSSPMVGKKSGTVFVSAALGTTTMVLPGAIPNGAFIEIGN